MIFSIIILTCLPLLAHSMMHRPQQNRFGMPRPHNYHDVEWIRVVQAHDDRNCVTGHKSGFQICVENKDMMKLDVDICTNAANTELAHGGGLARAFVVHGGQTIQDESDVLIKQFGPLKVSGTAVTSGGELSCRHVIHTVGPMWRGGEQGEGEALKLAVLNTLRTARRLCAHSVALPTISSGIYGFPKERAARLIVEAVLAYYSTRDSVEPSDTRHLPPIEPCDLTGARVPTRVLLVDTDPRGTDALIAELKRQFKE